MLEREALRDGESVPLVQDVADWSEVEECEGVPEGLVEELAATLALGEEELETDSVAVGQGQGVAEAEVDCEVVLEGDSDSVPEVHTVGDREAQDVEETLLLWLRVSERDVVGLTVTLALGVLLGPSDTVPLAHSVGLVELQAVGVEEVERERLRVPLAQPVAEAQEEGETLLEWLTVSVPLCVGLLLGLALCDCEALGVKVAEAEDDCEVEAESAANSSINKRSIMLSLLTEGTED